MTGGSELGLNSSKTDFPFELHKDLPVGVPGRLSDFFLSSDPLQIGGELIGDDEVSFGDCEQPVHSLLTSRHSSSINLVLQIAESKGITKEDQDLQNTENCSAKFLWKKFIQKAAAYIVFPRAKQTNSWLAWELVRDVTIRTTIFRSPSISLQLQHHTNSKIVLTVNNNIGLGLHTLHHMLQRKKPKSSKMTFRLTNT